MGIKVDEVVEQIQGVDPFERFARSYLEKDSTDVVKTIKRLRLLRLDYMKEKEKPVKKAKVNKDGKVVKTRGAKKDPSLAALEKVLKKVSPAQLAALAAMVKKQ